MRTSLLLLVAVLSHAQAIFIRNAEVHAMDQPARVASVLIDKGKFVAIGNLAAPDGAQVIDATGLKMYPGFIDSGTEVGLAEITSLKESVDTGEQGEFTPNLRAIVAVNPESEHFPVVRSNGITSVVTFPGGGKQIVAGLAALLHTDGWTWEQMSLQSAAALDVTRSEEHTSELQSH